VSDWETDEIAEVFITEDRSDLGRVEEDEIGVFDEILHEF